jgi:nicotinate-nucleotide adenylyltransferase
MSKKVGIFSGVFDPVHNGHIAFARMAARELGLSKVYFLVEPKPRRKSSVTDINDRLTMTWLAIQEWPELEVLTLPDKTFSVAKTLPWLQKRFKNTDLHLLMGSDLFNFVETWSGFKTLADAVTFVVGYRHQTGAEAKPVSSPNVAHCLLVTPFAAVASTHVRRHIPKARADVLSPEVDRYIRLNKLYASS